MEFVGVQKEKSFFRLAYLSIVNGEIVIECLEKETKAPIFKKDLLVATGIEGQALLIRHLVTPLRNARALHKTLPFQLEALIPYSLDDVIIKPIYEIGEKETHAHFFTVPKKTLEHHIANFQKENIDPEWVSAIPMALLRFASFVSPDEHSLVVFHIGMKKIQLVSVQEGKILSHITLHIGSQDLSDGDSAKVVSKLKREVDRAFCFLAHKEQESGSRKVLFCGERTKEVENLLMEEKDSLISPIEIEGHRGYNGETVRPYAISIGLAIDALKNDSLSIQFRQELFISKRTFSSIKKGLLRGSVLAGALFAVTLLCSQIFYHKKEKALMNQVEKLVSHYEKEIPSLKGGIKGSSLEEALSDLNLKLRLPKSGELIFSKPPLVTDFLCFISSHPKLKGMEVKRLDYELKSYPSLQRPKDQYRPKVRLVFTSKEAKKAREFHDAIIDDDTLVDRDGEIEWKRNEDEYEITFFLQTQF
ncbi:MAG: hypothetical protein KFB93_01665 [Simkaniaceae bacterium]|jgi:type IV pilus assembly protein PilM|nr:MAG: hypothetical protein KFB93_01665 [Simkaniaceae bacterium]